MKKYTSNQSVILPHPANSRCHSLLTTLLLLLFQTVTTSSAFLIKPFLPSVVHPNRIAFQSKSTTSSLHSSSFSHHHEEGEGRILPSSKTQTEPPTKKSPARFALPIFPLRKLVKFPTETITLNLYEERYLALAETVLQKPDQEQYFGALYCSTKPQMVKDGTGPITPLVEVGDVGVVCSVLENEEGLIPAKDGSLRKRIRLRGLVVGRFRIEKVFHNGYGGCAVDGEEPLPFILVEASRVDDVVPIPGSKGEKDVIELERKLFMTMLEVEGMVDRLLDDLWRGDQQQRKEAETEQEDDESYLSARRFAPWLPPDVDLPVSIKNKYLNNAAGNDNDDADRVEQAVYVWECGASNCEMEQCTLDDQRRQLFSFAMASTLIEDRSPEEMESLLKSRSTYERLEHVLEVVEEGRGWLAARKTLRDMF